MSLQEHCKIEIVHHKPSITPNPKRKLSSEGRRA
jgi:hypothetical protein